MPGGSAPERSIFKFAQRLVPNWAGLGISLGRSGGGDEGVVETTVARARYQID
jgi:hypothetical protein